MKKIVSILLALCMLLGVAFAEETTTSTLPELTDDTVCATVNGVDITWASVSIQYDNLISSYGSYYDTSLDSTIELFRAAALDNAIITEVLNQKAAELGFTEISDADKEAAIAEADAIWDEAVNNYIEYYYGTPSELSEEALAAAKEAANTYWEEQGYTQEAIRTSYVEYLPQQRLYDYIMQDVTVTDEEVAADYQAVVDSDKALYENDLKAYCDYSSMVELYAYYGYDMDYPMYIPAGFRTVKHILLEVDETILTTYTELLSTYEEQQETLAAGGALEEGVEAVTEEQVNEAKAAVLDNVSAKIDEINNRLANGEEFEALINEYTLDSDNSYNVCEYSSNYVSAFVEAAMSIEEVGGISAPYISDYGVHIVKYISDVPAGPVEETEEETAARKAELLETKQEEAYTAAYELWLSEATVTYTGAIKSMEELQAEEAEATDTEEPAEETTTAE